MNYIKKLEEQSKISSSQNINNDSKSLASFKMQSKHNREEFLRKTENSEKSKKLNSSDNKKNNVSYIANNVSINSDQLKMSDTKSKAFNDYKNYSESKSNKSNFSKVSFNNNVSVNNNNNLAYSNKLGMSFNDVGQNI